MLSFEALEDTIESPDTEREYRFLRNAFCETLSETDAQIFCLCEDGYKQEEIAKKLGYKSQGTVAKHLMTMRKQFDAFMNDNRT